MPDARVKSGAEAVCEALDVALARRPEVYLLGEGIADPKGIFGTSTGLVDKYGPKRVVEMPVAENGLTGIAIGSALVGQRPVMVHQRVDFALLAVEQIFNAAAKMHYVSNGKHSVPLVIRMIIGRGWGQGPAHSQHLEPLFALIPGLKVVMPFTPYDTKGMLLAAIEDDNPVMFLEHRWIHYMKGEVPDGYYTVPLEGPRRAHEGNDVTIVATSYMVAEALCVAEAFAPAGIGCDVFDLRVIRPLNIALIAESVRRTGRLIFVDTGFRAFGIGAEVVSRVVEETFPFLKAAPTRLGLADHPTPASRSLVTEYYPHTVQLADAVQRVTGASNSIIAPVRQTLMAVREATAIDQPDKTFQGPF